ncbi:hypothetical protein [Nitrobacter sp.]|uniref:hypothetical protein n=1 Tax=Nitrobacter sp. TaxID=29420 RepID=UPI001D4950F2|nr:hypothetical protein [Nitrobacter sp.]MCB1393705.1 hypothetical protein [Nitrobacter sp.]
MSGFYEDIVEQTGIETLKALGWMHLHGSVIAPDGASPQRLLPSNGLAALVVRVRWVEWTAFVMRLNIIRWGVAASSDGQ